MKLLSLITLLYCCTWIHAQIILPPHGEEAVKLQIFLDQKMFGPGYIDGKPGTFTKLAIENYNTSQGRKLDDPQILSEVTEAITTPYATAIIPSDVDQYVDSSLPEDRTLQAKRKYMSYRSILEFMAERYHTSEELLREINAVADIKSAAAHTALLVPNVTPFKVENYQSGRSHKTDEILTSRHIIVDTEQKQLFIYELIIPDEESFQEGALSMAQPKLIASYPITPGKSQFIPKGYWNLKNSIELPVWRYDKQLLETGVRGKESLNIPAGPNNPIGIIWNGLTKSGIGIHGTDNPLTIGRAQSAGCIRMANWDAARIPELVRPGAVVVIK
ncbi:MAG: L,D-transpeptidase [Akkermansiaceae bacterium]